MKRMTSDIIKALQNCVDKYGDLPFECRDDDNGCSFADVSIFADTVENGGCLDGDGQVIGISF